MTHIITSLKLLSNPVGPPWVLGLVTLLSLALFAWAIWPKWQVLRLAAPENRWDRIGDRLLHTLKIALGQTKMFKDKGPGWMHALIFWGFLVLLLRAAEFFWIGFFSPDHIPHSSAAGGWWSLLHKYYAVKDGFVVLVTLACVYALYRRLVSKPKRLNLSGEGILILLLILAIMMSDVLFEASQQTWSVFGEANLSWLGLWVNQLLPDMSWSATQTLHQAAYWTHILSILVFICLLPRSKHFHIITSIPNVFFSNASDTGNGLHRLDFDDESRESFGVARIEEFSWKKLLDLHTCTECGRCDVFCPALNSGKPLSPKQFTIDLRDHLNDRTQALTSNSAEGEHPVMGAAIQDETVWSCTTCGACEEECPVMIEYVNKMVDLRQGMVMMDSRFPKELNEAFKSLETHSNPWGFAASTRADWAQSLDVKRWDKNQPTEFLYFVGCNGSFDSRGKAVAESVVRLLRSAGVDFSILGDREGCTGDPARRLGNEYLFDMLASQNAEMLKEQGVIKIVTHCPHCFNSFKNEYPEFGVKLDVIHHSELFAILVREGKLKLEKQEGETVVFHDSCYMGRHNGMYDPPRALLNEVVEPDSLREVETSRERGTCCGAGGGRFLLEESTGTRMSHNRVDELMQTQPDTIAVSCPFCVLMLEDGLKAKNLSGQVKIKDLSEFLK